ncbi:cysteine desulfurase [Lachnospiraceae bacterium XBB2008]|nr:cysteine desulfurase [Lachnospiraceae bacterium XBB2008]
MNRSSENSTIYMDHAATTPMYPEVNEAMFPYMEEMFGNPSAVYRFAGKSARAVADARGKIARTIGALPEEIYFTSGGSESDNWALFSVCEERGFKNCHIITTQIEHHAIIEVCKRLEKLGVEVTYLPVSAEGLVDPALVEKSIRPETVIISVMMANNEIGTIEPVAEIGQIAREKGILFHTDAVQALGHIPIDVGTMNIDLMSASAHKLGGPKGVGLLYVRKGQNITPFISGGSQERGKRAGTLNVPGIVGFGEAALRACSRMDTDSAEVTHMRDHMISRLLTELPGSSLNGHPTKRLPGNVNISFEGIEGETALIMLDRAGICVSSGSACSSGALDPSHVLLAIGRSRDEARSAIRITPAASNRMYEVDAVIDKLEEIIRQLRGI